MTARVELLIWRVNGTPIGDIFDPSYSERGIYDRPWLSGIPNARETQGASVPFKHILGQFCYREERFRNGVGRGKCFFGLQSFHHVFFNDLQA
jgi:hypothetical protein